MVTGGAGPTAETQEDGMHGSKDDLPLATKEDGWVTHGAEWGGMTTTFDLIRPGYDWTEAFAPFPDGLCPVRHWGYVRRGRMRIRYRDREESIGAGEAFYLEPGHLPLADEETEVVFFSPTDEVRRAEAVLEGQAEGSRPEA
jgi:hypothetical protein